MSVSVEPVGEGVEMSCDSLSADGDVSGEDDDTKILWAIHHSVCESAIGYFKCCFEFQWFPNVLVLTTRYLRTILLASKHAKKTAEKILLCVSRIVILKEWRFHFLLASRWTICIEMNFVAFFVSRVRYWYNNHYTKSQFW